GLHASAAGCRLILSPTLDRPAPPPPPPDGADPGARAAARRVRLESLREFLTCLPDGRAQVVFSDRACEAHLSIVGDGFSAESVVARPGLDWRQTVFTTHPPSVLRSLRRFDEEFAALASARDPGAGGSRQEALDRIERILDG